MNLRLVCELGMIAVRMDGGYFRDNGSLANFHNPCETYSMKITLISERTFFRFSNIQEKIPRYLRKVESTFKDTLFVNNEHLYTIILHRRTVDIIE